jgi:hypothetical protein
MKGIRHSLSEIRAIASGSKPGVRPSDQVQAWRAMAQVALARTISTEELRARLINQVQVTRKWAAQHGIPKDLLEALFEAQEEAWR